LLLFCHVSLSSSPSWFCCSSPLPLLLICVNVSVLFPR
jgi:hypothetical protein